MTWPYDSPEYNSLVDEVTNLVNDPTDREAVTEILHDVILFPRWYFQKVRPSDKLYYDKFPLKGPKSIYTGPLWDAIVDHTETTLQELDENVDDAVDQGYDPDDVLKHVYERAYYWQDWLPARRAFDANQDFGERAAIHDEFYGEVI